MTYATLREVNGATALLLTETYSTVSSYTLIVIPMFILLGNIASAAGFSRGLYDAANAWVGRFPGGSPRRQRHGDDHRQGGHA